MGIAVDLVGSSQTGSRWYVAQTRPRDEALARRHLANQDFVSFCPTIVRVARGGARRAERLEALFPGYVYVQLDLERQRWRSVNGTIGVLRLVAFGAAGHALPVALPREFVEQLQALGGEHGQARFAETLVPGQNVRVIGGPFDQMSGQLSSLDALGRVTVLLDILAKQTRVRMRRAMLVAA